VARLLTGWKRSVTSNTKYCEEGVYHDNRNERSLVWMRLSRVRSRWLPELVRA